MNVLDFSGSSEFKNVHQTNKRDQTCKNRTFLNAVLNVNDTVVINSHLTLIIMFVLLFVDSTSVILI